MNELAPENLAIALHSLKDEAEKAFPHNIYPVRTTGAPFTQTEWIALEWNPVSVQFAKNNGIADRHDTRNFVFSKPTWQAIVDREKAVALKYIRHELTPRLRKHCQTLIVQAYGAKDTTHELQIRLDNRHTQTADSKRNELRARYALIKSFIDTTTDRNILAQFNPAADKHWDLSTAFTPPTTETQP